MTNEEALKILKTKGCYECAWGCESPYTCTAAGCGVMLATKKAVEVLEKMKIIEELVKNDD